MPENVEITYSIRVAGREQIEDLIRKHKEAGDVISKVKSKFDTFTDAQQKSESINLKLRRSIIALRREMFFISVAIGSVTSALILAAKFSENFGVLLEDLTRGIKQWTAVAVDSWSKMFGLETGRMAFQSLQQVAGYNVRFLKASGKTMDAFREQQKMEWNKLLNDLGERMDRQANTLRTNLQKAQLAEEASFRRGRFGVKTGDEIKEEAAIDLFRSSQAETADVLFKFLQAERQTFIEVLKGFQTVINRAISEALAKALFSFLFNRLDPRAKEIKEKLDQIQKCVCDLAQRTGGGGGGARTITIESIGKASKALGIIGSISGTVGMAASLGAGLANLPNIIKGATPSIAMGAGASGSAFGGEIPVFGTSGNFLQRTLPKFQSGGEVPAMLHAGEFVVNAKAAQRNKGALRNMNAGGSGGNNFYVSINANDAKSFDDMLSTQAARDRINVQVVRLIMENSEVRRIIKDFAK